MADLGATAGANRERHKGGQQLWGRRNVQERLDEHRRPAGVRRGAEFRRRQRDRAEGEGHHEQGPACQGHDRAVVHWPPADDNDEKDDDDDVDDDHHHHCQSAVFHCSNQRQLTAACPVDDTAATRLQLDEHPHVCCRQQRVCLTNVASLRRKYYCGSV
ncbi:uncharacterized protein LOC126470281 isoform X2 [Schistocerca serialis cubense]|uniref:uncharacterized protein LOC126470281 isoform X2 n=1 Tax=Schistocerca serialis cubense TaxID=2023355 RepID=UPI00214E2D0A|nr:uncharacterized protein LOC126470281 isoform X2 [Schistocerca serialis cubense]